jgi:hypothetical protein
MVVTWEHKTFYELWVPLTPRFGGSGTYSYFLPYKLCKYEWGKWKWKNVTYFKFLHIKDGVLLVTEETESICQCPDCKVGLCKKSCFKLFHT